MELITKAICKICKGTIVEKITVKYGQSNGIIGPGAHTPKYVVSEGFNCKDCGIKYESTLTNNLVNANLKDSEIYDVVMNSSEHEIKRHLSPGEFLSGDGNPPDKELEEAVYNSYPKIYIQHSGRKSRFDKKVNYYLAKTKKGLRLIDDRVKYKDGKKKKVAKIGNVKLKKPTISTEIVQYREKIPKNAIPATLVFVIDENFKKHYFYIPTSAIEA